MAYKPLAYKPTLLLPPPPPSKPLCHAFYLPPGQTDSPHLYQNIDKHLWNFTFCKSQTNMVSLALELWRVEGPSTRGLFISALSAGGEGVSRIWEIRVSTFQNIGWFDMELSYYYHYYYYNIFIFMYNNFIIFYFILKIRKDSVPVYDYRIVVRFVI